MKKGLYLVVARYFRFFATISLRRWRPRVIAVTGSVGKTTMLHLLEVMLGKDAHYSHLANSAYGIAFDIVGLRGVQTSKLEWFKLCLTVPFRALYFTRQQQFYVVEIDSERPHEAAFIANWLQPEVTLWISCDRSHAVYYDKQVASGQFTDVDTAIAHGFAAVARATTKLVIIDGDNAAMRRETKQLQAALTAVTAKNLRSYDVTPQSAAFRLQSGTFVFHEPMPRETYIQLAQCERLMNYLKRPITHDLAAFVVPPGRNNFFVGIKGTRLIDSSYNAHLISMRSMIAMLDAMKHPHKWAVIGDMVEQGKGEADEHRKLGEVLLTSDFETIVLVGRRVAEHTAAVLTDTSKTVVSFVDTRDALDYLTSHLQGGETILFKGSQYLEWLVEKLLLHPEDTAFLARQDPAAKARRRARGLV